MENKQPCTCGKTYSVYHPAENQHEPACWECYDRLHSVMLVMPSGTHVLAPEEEYEPDDVVLPSDSYDGGVDYSPW